MPKIKKDIQQRMQSETLQREFSLDTRAIDEEARTVELAFSSELEYERWFGIEILDHRSESVDMSRMVDGAALLMDHSWRDQVGVVVSARIDSDKVGRAVVKFSRSQRGQEVFQDVLDGIRTKVSVGYKIHEAQLEKTGDEGDTYRITRWEPFEVSLVSVPADPSVGVGRSVSEHSESKAGAMPEITQRKEVVMTDKVDNKEKGAPAIDLDAARSEARADAIKAERTRTQEIEAVAQRAAKSLNGAEINLAREAIAAGKSVDAFRESILEKMNERASDQRSPLGLSDAEANSFSFNRAIAAAAQRDWSNAGFEREVCEATAKRFGGKGKGIYIPTDVLSRAVTSTVAAANIQTDVLASSFIELLRARMMVRKLGATVLGGLDGNISVPRQTAASNAAWVAEGGALTRSDQGYDAVALSPKGVVAGTTVTLQALMQTSPDVEALTRTDIAKVIALAIDAACINGTGSGAQPRGILNTAGIGSVAMGPNGAALSNVDQLVNLETLVGDSDADVETMSYLTNTKVVGQMKKLKTTTGEYLFSSKDRALPSAILGANGYDLFRSNQMPRNLTKGTSAGVCSSMIFGDWSSLLIGEWGALNLQVDPYTSGIGNINIDALQFVDAGVRHPESFAAITDILA